MSDGVPPEQVAYINEVRDYFNSFPKFKVDKLAGLGRHGGALLLSENDDEGNRLRRIVVKFSLGQYASDEKSNADEDLRNEVTWLMMLRGAEHVSNACLEKKPSDLSAQLQNLSIQAGKETQEEKKPGESNKEKERRTPVTFALEFLEGGTMRDFREKPHLIATAVLNGVRQGEDMFRSGYNGFAGITQNSGHIDNAMFSMSALPPDTEHPPTIPALKLIDFGRGKDDNLDPIDDLVDPLETGSKINLWGVANIMANVICPFEDHDGPTMDLASPPMPYNYTANGVGRFVWTNAPAPLRGARHKIYVISLHGACLKNCTCEVFIATEAMHLTSALPVEFIKGN
ncbi:hypothetical protein GGR57DRAFT_500676 [Xylariaceae sp. FL1272]|nr:hypothetical protein GGR57DRAFT_500676 [Xylariaceae sp. FL1272]